MIRSRFLRLAAAGVAFAGALQIGGGQVARADATGHSTTASCMGYESSSISPPGSSEEELGGAPQFASEIKEIAADLGIPSGGLFAFIASLHAGSHEDCDEALE
jgi:hypothetical protein